ncbi:Fc.00g001480.m01.CDS01 [Cosmosporella sp. VM-42]
MSNLITVLTVGMSLLAPTSATATHAATYGATKSCIELQVPIQVSATNPHYASQRVDSNIDAMNWLWDTYTWSHPNLTTRITGEIYVHEKFNISARLYWDVQFRSGQYSYVDAAIAHGYSILMYDRIGTGGSSKPDAYTVVESPTEVEVLKELTKLVRSGNLIASSKVRWEGSRHDIDAFSRKPSKVVHVGHSFGSIVTIGMLTSYGELSDGAILTGFILGSQTGGTKSSEYGFEFAPANDAQRFGDCPSGYLVQATESNIQYIFLKKGTFEPGMLCYAESIKQTVTVGELMSGGVPLGKPAPAFKGPVKFFLGEYDNVVCRGDCKNTYDPEILKSLYPAATDVSVYLQPETGHALTMSTNATAGYKVMFSYLKAHSL